MKRAAVLAAVACLAIAYRLWSREPAAVVDRDGPIGFTEAGW